MSEIYNFSPEFVSKDELEVLANFYTQKIVDVDHELSRLPEHAHNSYEYKVLRKEKFALMQRRYYIRVCIRNRQNRTQN